MREVVVVTGPPGAGKTTVCARLSQVVPGTARITGDILRAFTPDDARDHLGSGSTYRAAGALARAYLRMGAPRVLVDYVFRRAADVELLRDELGPADSLTVFVLWTDLDVLRSRVRGRGRPMASEALERTWRQLGECLAELGQVVPNDGAPDDAVKAIEGRLRHAYRRRSVSDPPHRSQTDPPPT